MRRFPLGRWSCFLLAACGCAGAGRETALESRRPDRVVLPVREANSLTARREPTAPPAIHDPEILRVSDEVAPAPESAQTAEPQTADATPPEPVVEDSPTSSLSLSAILQLTESQNPNIALAQERIREAYARVDRADSLWLPSIRAGINANHHEGRIQDVAGHVINTNRSSIYGGLGANAVGAGSPAVPGLVANFHLSDAIYQPRIAGQQAASRQYAATAARNDTLRDAAVAYLELQRAEQGVAIAREALDNTRQLEDLARHYAESGQGLQSDLERMRAEVALREEQLASQVESQRVASSRLAQLLHADASIRISTEEATVVPLEIVSIDRSASQLVAEGLSRRPELAEHRHLVCEAVERWNREKYAPFVPSVMLGLSYGALGGGLGSNITNGGDRWDADAIAYWEIRNLGVGEEAARCEAASSWRQAQLRQVAQLDRVAREVTEAHARVVHGRERMELAQAGIVSAQKSYDLNKQRIENAQGLPIETLQAIQALATARRAYLNAVVDYNIAQFELCRSTGWFIDGEPRN